MTSVLIDTNIFIDIFGRPCAYTSWSGNMLKQLRREASFVLSPIVWAELAGLAGSEREMSVLTAPLGLIKETLPFEAAYKAGLAHVMYRRQGGARERTLPDFLIGAHATIRAHRLLTRDPNRYRAYFPDLEIISPETHP
ncbi:type II toxin-antitoxin system VapC family toxin [Rhizobium sp. C4]|uniref:type II toxin-antitoxin system VapC family toxin n=1 Tax=Rhizobium sp. C4 TaxID=1349800 RepID=UPI001E5C7747|nr:type II toxin-antitoxin system VapC family toxin [Rhizobium sp. C4]MCD2174117.1 type II toxin-antitoxin system VapC family toxin [Rhizobium sp. C4]